MTRSVTLLALIALAGCDRLPGKPDPDEHFVRPSEITSFDVLYGTSCAGCHGADGRMGAAHPMNDPLYLALVTDDALTRAVADGVPGTLMPAFAERRGGPLTDEQVEIIVRGMRERWATPAAFEGASLPPYEADGGSVERGRKVYESACARCHDAGAGSIVDPFYLDLVSDQSLRVSVICGRPDLDKPDFRSVDPGGALSDRQIADVVAWIASHRRAPGASP